VDPNREGAFCENLKGHLFRQSFDRPILKNIESHLCEQLETCPHSFEGQSLAIAVGSRGIHKIDVMLACLISWLKSKGAFPFIVPAMGSHGGASAQGQLEVLSSLGVTEALMKCPIRSSMEVVDVGDPKDPEVGSVYVDKMAHESDGIIVLNRIKPHTSFHGVHESGLMKMLSVGLGKARGAKVVHGRGVEGLAEWMPKAARVILKASKVCLGIGIVENAYDETMALEVCQAQEIPSLDAALLLVAKQNMPSLPVSDIDLLMVDEMGKNISGTGMDTHLIGRLKILGQDEPLTPNVKVISVHSLTAESHGNATGMGLADLVSQRLCDAVDRQKTQANILTTGFLERAKMPFVVNRDMEVLEAAAAILRPKPMADLRIVRIANTLKPHLMWVSSALEEDMLVHPRVENLERFEALFDDEGDLRFNQY
jgi:hypothetical protein